jgi:hypothetical protein
MVNDNCLVAHKEKDRSSHIVDLGNLRTTTRHEIT